MKCNCLTEEDLRWIRELFEELEKADDQTKREFYIKAGIYREDGTVTDLYKDLFPEKI